MLYASDGYAGVCIVTPQEYFDPKQVMRRAMRLAAKQPPVKGTVVYASSRLNKPPPNAWPALHAYDGCDPVWHAEWELTIPDYGCSCRKDYAEYKAANPPDFSSPTAYWLWGVHLHNWVNRKLGKTELTVEEARAIWRRQDGVTEQGEGVG
jgi:hypothetical protein